MKLAMESLTVTCTFLGPVMRNHCKYISDLSCLSVCPPPQGSVATNDLRTQQQARQGETQPQQLVVVRLSSDKSLVLQFLLRL